MPDWDTLESQYRASDSPPRPRRPLSSPVVEQHHFTDTRPLARWLVGMLLVGMVLRGMAIAASWVLRGWYNGDARPAGEFHVVIDRLAIVAGIGIIVVTVVTAILWVVWLWYAYSNLPALGREPLYRNFWVWLGWFVPIWNLFRPKELHNEVWRSGGDEKIPFWFHFWWFLYLASVTALNGVPATEYTWADVVAYGVGILAAIPAVAVVWISAARQWNKRHEEDAWAVRSPGPLAKYASTAVGVLSFGMAALLILMPHSEDLPEGAQVTGLLDLEAGECFTGDEAEGLGLIWVVDCSGPHTGESVGAVEIDAVSYPGVNAMSNFATIGCWSSFYEYAGDTADNLDYELEWYSPLGVSWEQGYEWVVCLVTHVDDATLSTSLADPDSHWIAFDDLREDRCYEFHDTLLAASELPCSRGGLRVGTLERYRNDPLLAFPGAQVLEDDLSCPSAMLDTIVPNSESWILGDRVSVCLTPQTGST